MWFYTIDKLFYNYTVQNLVWYVINASFPVLTTTDLAESDLAYTQGLMNKGKENFTGKEVLILGGGDGALLWELLKEKPKFVTMIDVSVVSFSTCR